MMKLSTELKESLFGLAKTFDGQTPIKKVDGEYFLKVDEIQMNKNGAVFLFKGVPLIQYDATISIEDSTLTFTNIEALVKFEVK